MLTILLFLYRYIYTVTNGTNTKKSVCSNLKIPTSCRPTPETVITFDRQDAIISEVQAHWYNINIQRDDKCCKDGRDYFRRV